MEVSERDISGGGVLGILPARDGSRFLRVYEEIQGIFEDFPVEFPGAPVPE
jgi:hypothetical protein